jgi:cytochrome P450/NADPH-cytochrome P450 reductase
MFPQMVDGASQLILKWDRLQPENCIGVIDEFTRLALDIIAIFDSDTDSSFLYPG